jgi:hypothetical protein
MTKLQEANEGEYVAIGPKGETILGADDIEVVEKAIKEFGSGNFILHKVGFRAIGKWRRPAALKARTSRTLR